MFASLRRERLPLLLLFIQALALALAAETGTRQGWLWAFAVVALINLWGWLLALHYGRAIGDTPTSRVASAAQGYVELQGRAEPHAGVQAISPVTQLPCLWFRYVLERQSGDKWHYRESGESDQPFDLDDGSGRCVLYPQGAQIHSSHKETRQVGDLRHTEWVLLKGDRLYAIGEFGSTRGADVELDARRDEGELLAAWKEDQAALHARFDLDADGDISAREWSLARLAARREIEHRHRQIRDRPTLHWLREPDNGRPYLIANHAPEILARRYWLWAALYLALFFAALAGFGWSMRLP